MAHNPLQIHLKNRLAKKTSWLIGLIACLWAIFSYHNNNGPYYWVIEAQLAFTDGISYQLTLVGTLLLCVMLVTGFTFVLPATLLRWIESHIPIPEMEGWSQEESNLMGVTLASMLGAIHFLAIGLVSLNRVEVDIAALYQGRAPSNGTWTVEGRFLFTEDNRWSFHGMSHYLPLVPLEWDPTQPVKVVAVVDASQYSLLKKASGPVSGVGRLGAMPAFVRSRWVSRQSPLASADEVYLLEVGADGWMERMIGMVLSMFAIITAGVLYFRVRSRAVKS